MKKLLLCLSLLCLCAGCATPAECPAVPTDEELVAQGWVKNPEENGYMKLETDTITSATSQGAGLTFGFMDQSDAMKQKTVLEYLSGNNNTYREMYQIATSYNNVPTISSVEFVLDPTNFNLYGLSEKGTEKTLQYESNPNVSLYWTRQLRESEEAMGMTYFTSYGVQITGTVHMFTEDELNADPTELLHLFDTYYPTMPTTAAVWARQETKEQKIAYIKQVLTQQVVYKIVPSMMVITQPYMLHMGGAYASCAIYTNKDAGYKYPSEFVSAEFLDAIIGEKVTNEEYLKKIDELYPAVEIVEGMSEDEVKVAQTNNATRDLLLGNNTCGIKTQQILTNFTPAK